MPYELWDVETANLVGDYATEEAALAVVHQSLQAHGPGAVAHLALAFEDAAGDTHPIASGPALAERAGRSASVQGTASASTP